MILQDEEEIAIDLINAISLYYPSNAPEHNDELNDVVDFIQENLECCGVIGIDDWLNFSPYYMELNRLPASCCGHDEEASCTSSEAFTDVRLVD